MKGSPRREGMRDKPKRPTPDDFLHYAEFEAFARWVVYADATDEWLKTEVLPVLCMSRHILPDDQALGECGRRAWNELDDDAQTSVMVGRETISTLIAQLGDTQGADHGCKEMSDKPKRQLLLDMPLGTLDREVYDADAMDDWLKSDG